MVKIGLEIHSYLNTTEKLFCSCKAEHGFKNTKPNVNICPIGTVNYLPNSGSTSTAIFDTTITNWGGIDVDQSYISTGYSSPELIDSNEFTSFLLEVLVVVFINFQILTTI